MVLVPNAGSPPQSTLPRPPMSIVLTVLKWLARLVAAFFVLTLGAFFVEHIGEWYSQPSRGLPPWWVHLSMLSHFALMAGLVMLFRWERIGSLTAILGAFGFIASVAIGQATLRLPYIILLALIPVGIIAIRLMLLRLAARP